MNFFDKFDAVTLGAVGVLALYSILSLSIFIYRFTNLNTFLAQERGVLAALLRGGGLGFDAYFKPANAEKNKLTTLFNQAQTKLSEGLTWLSIIASTSPFIGLFGTVISIYLTLITLSDSSAEISKIAAPIGQALIATAAGIVSAVLAYTFHLIIRRKFQECLSVLSTQLDILLDEKH